MARQKHQPGGGRSAQSGGRSGVARREPDWLRGKRPIFQFVGLFIVFMVGFYALTFLPFMNKGFLPYYLELNARMSAVVLNIFGENADASGTTVSSPRYSVDIHHGCDALEPSVLFIAAVLAFPAKFLLKIPGLLAGTVILSIINLIRIVSLFYSGIHFQQSFEFLHEDVWQSLFVLLALVLWVLWAWWASKVRAPKMPAAA